MPEASSSRPKFVNKRGTIRVPKTTYATQIVRGLRQVAAAASSVQGGSLMPRATSASEDIIQHLSPFARSSCRDSHGGPAPQNSPSSEGAGYGFHFLKHGLENLPPVLSETKGCSHSDLAQGRGGLGLPSPCAFHDQQLEGDALRSTVLQGVQMVRFGHSISAGRCQGLLAGRR